MRPLIDVRVAVPDLDALLVDSLRREPRPKLLRQIRVDELLQRGKTLVRCDGKLYRIECREVEVFS